MDSRESNAVVSADTNPLISGLRELYNASPGAREILDNLAAWEDRKVTSVKRLHRRLDRAGSMLERQDVAEFFQALHAIGLGELLAGNGARRPRFVWGYPLTRLSLVASGEAWELEPLRADTPDHEEGDVDDDLLEDEPPAVAASEIAASEIKHIYRLRGNYTVKVTLPMDLTATEAARLADFIRTLPFGS